MAIEAVERTKVSSAPASSLVLGAACAVESTGVVYDGPDLSVAS